jgi:hypothetical protein
VPENVLNEQLAVKAVVDLAGVALTDIKLCALLGLSSQWHCTEVGQNRCGTS